MDPVVYPIIGSIAVAIVSGVALVRSSRTNAVATATASLVDGQQRALLRLDALVAAKDSIIEDLRSDHISCQENLAALTIEFERQGHDLQAAKDSLAAAHESIELQGNELARLRTCITEIGDERLP